MLPSCPLLPTPPIEMDASALSAHGDSRDAEFYLTALKYANYLWQRGLVARGILKIDRALGADVHGEEAILQQWPMPYSAMAYFLRHAPAGVFMGNPRVHFQHLADRMNEPRRDQRRWRIWACWALCRLILPDLPSDPKHEVEEPTFEKISDQLNLNGIPGETELWLAVVAAEKARNSS